MVQPIISGVSRQREPNDDAVLAPSSEPGGPARGVAAGRIMGLDVGSRTIGVAVSDPLGITAQGLETIRRRNKRQDLSALHRLIRDYGVVEIVVGYPLRMQGQVGIQAERVAEFAAQLRERFHLPVHLRDERLTTVQAQRVLREAELSIEKRARAVDRLAAVLILQSFLDSRSQ